MFDQETAPTRAASWAGATLLACACSAEPAPPVAWASAPAACVAERRALTLEDGAEVYVEPQDLIAVGGDTIVVGEPSYVWDVGPDRTAWLRARVAHIAAVLGPPVRLVPKPIEGRVGAVRAVALDDRRWAALVEEIEADAPTGRDTMIALWYAERDGDEWAIVEPVAYPRNAGVGLRTGSALVQMRDRLAWAALDAGPGRGAVHFHERLEGAWEVSTVPGVDLVEGVALGWGQVDGAARFWLAVVGADHGGSGRERSIRLYRRVDRRGEGATWELVQTVAPVQDAEITYALTVTVQGASVTVSWLAAGAGGMRAMARVGIAPGAPGELHVLDRGARYLSHTQSPDGGSRWVVDHVDAVTGLTALRVVRVTASGIERLDAGASPYTGFFATLAVAGSRVLVVGAEMGTVPTQTPVRSLVLRLSTSC